MTADIFDFSKFMAEAANPSEAVKREMLRDAVSEELGPIMGEICPRIWCVMQTEMMKDKKNNIHLNAVINASIFAVLGFVAACTPKGETDGRDNDDALREKFIKNLDNALKNSRENGAQMSSIASTIGKLKLMEDSLSNLATIVVQNSMIVKGIHSYISGAGKKPNEPQGAKKG